MDPLRRLRGESGAAGDPAGVNPSELARLVGERTAALQREIGQLRERAAQMQRIYEQSSLLIGSLALQDDALFLLTGSVALASLFDVARADLAARPLRDLGIAAADAARWSTACREAERLALPQRFALDYAGGGSSRSFSGLVGTLGGAAAGARTFWFTLDETTASRAAEAAAAERERLVETLIEGAPVGVQLFDRAGVSLRTNATQRALLGLPRLSNAALARAGAPPSGPPAQTLMLERRFFPLTDSGGAVRTIVAFTSDVTGRTADDSDCLDEVRRLSQLTETMAAGLVAFDREGRVSYANAAAERLLDEAGAAAESGPSPRLRGLIAEGSPFAAVARAFNRVREADAPLRDLEIIVERAAGGHLTLSASVAPLRAEDGAFDGAVAVLNDVTAQRRVEEALRAEAIRDQLTGLYNRRYMEESLRREIHGAERRGNPLTVVMLDIDNFKHFNDEYGHAAGDLMLASIGAYLQQHIRAGDIACRYGGEELTLIFPDTSIEDTRRRVDGLRQQLRELRVTYRDRELGGVALSAGIAGMPAHGDTPEALLRIADEALYRAKASGRDRVVVGAL